jgi:hypothetical protein
MEIKNQYLNMEKTSDSTVNDELLRTNVIR